MNENKKVEYRKFLDTQSNFKKIVNIKDEGILNKINLTYRLNYLKDSVIAYNMDDMINLVL